MKKIMFVFGTRPEAIKMCPIIKEFERNSNLEIVTVVTGQHEKMVTQVLEVFSIEAKYNLKVMEPKQSLAELSSKIILKMNDIYSVEKPDIVLVHGDTTTTYAAAMCAFYNKIPIGHVEAGLRTNDKYSPFPEEMNRVLTDSLADIYFAPTSQSKENLILENRSRSHIIVTGNTAIDAIKYTIKKNFQSQALNLINDNKKLILLTIHRRENWGDPMKRVFEAVTILTKKRQNIEIIFPMHPNPVVRNLAKQYFEANPAVHLTEPMELTEFHNLINRCHLILTDSGGIQEEAPYLGKPVLVLRESTERPEGVAAGTLKLVGTDENNIVQEVTNLLDDAVLYEKMSKAKNPYGDGNASSQIVEAIENYLAIGENIVNDS